MATRVRRPRLRGGAGGEVRGQVGEDLRLGRLLRLLLRDLRREEFLVLVEWQGLATIISIPKRVSDSTPFPFSDSLVRWG